MMLIEQSPYREDRRKNVYRLTAKRKAPVNELDRAFDEQTRKRSAS